MKNCKKSALYLYINFTRRDVICYFLVFINTKKNLIV